MSEQFALDPDNEFEASIIEIVSMQRAKNRDYAEDSSIFSNFEMTAELTNQLPEESALFNVAQKLVRLRSLKANGRTADPTNESVQDTYLDLAVYGCIAYAIVRQSAQAVATEQRREMLKGVTDEINRTVGAKHFGDVRVSVNTTGLSGEEVAMQARQQLEGIDWAAGRRQW